MEFAQYGEDDMDEMKNQLLTATKISQGPSGSVHPQVDEDSEITRDSQFWKPKRKGRGRGGYGRE